MAEAVLSLLINKLGEFAAAEASSLGEGQLQIWDDVKFIKDELSIMEAFLRVAELKCIRDDAVREWVVQMRDEAYKLEDVLEEFIVRMDVINSRRQATGCPDLKSCISHVRFFLNQFALRHQFHSEIGTIRREIGEISERRHRYHLEGAITSSNQVDEGIERNHAASYPFNEEADIIGIEKDVKQLQEFLKEECLIISVVGQGGSGKTTLVKKVYNNNNSKFDCHAWISVSQVFKMRQNLQLMLKGFYRSRSQVAPESVDMITKEELVEIIHKYLQGKRYRLVLDDVWDSNHWEAIKPAMPREGRSKVILTTRLVAVPNSIDEVCNIHHMNPLSRELAWELFCKKAFRNSTPQGYCPTYLKQTGEALVKKCDGMPLAIVSIGRLMSKKSSSLSEWDEVLENLDWELNHNSYLEKLNRVLLTSYNYLPPPLKYCFLYCGTFPEDHRIKRSRLIRIWVAEGLIKNHPRKTLEDVANGYLVQLVDRGFLQFDDDVLNIGQKICRVHDLLRDIANHMLKKEEFGEVLKNQSSNTLFKGQLHVAIHSDEVSVQQNMKNLSTRSIQIFSELPYEILHSLLSNLKRLRVLELSEINLERLPTEVGDMVHLCYLSIRSTRISELPTSLQNLYNLQTLDARDTLLMSFPGMLLRKLQKLRHLLLGKREDKVYVTLEDFTTVPKNLQTLLGAAANNGLVRELGNLTGLRRLNLEIVQGQHFMELCSHINKMQDLRKLKIRCQRYEEVLHHQILCSPPRYLEALSLTGTMRGELPTWIGLQNCLRTIHLFHSLLEADPMSILSKLPSLEVLLLDEAYTGRKMSWGDSCDKPFPVLKSLIISNMQELEELGEIKEGMMQCLLTLMIWRCPKLEKIPHGFQHLKSLRHLNFSDMPQGFIKRLHSYRVHGHGNRCDEDYWMIQHIPMVSLGKTNDTQGQRHTIITEQLPTVGV